MFTVEAYQNHDGRGEPEGVRLFSVEVADYDAAKALIEQRREEEFGVDYYGARAASPARYWQIRETGKGPGVFYHIAREEGGWRLCGEWPPDAAASTVRSPGRLLEQGQ